MNKSQLVHKLSERTGQGKQEIRDIVDTLTELIIEETKAGDRVFLPGFGSFKPRLQTSRPARNPRNGDVIQLSPRTIIHFKCATNLIEQVNKD